MELRTINPDGPRVETFSAAPSSTPLLGPEPCPRWAFSNLCATEVYSQTYLIPCQSWHIMTYGAELRILFFPHGCRLLRA